MNSDMRKATEQTRECRTSLRLSDHEIKQPVGVPTQCFMDVLAHIIVEVNILTARKRDL